MKRIHNRLMFIIILIFICLQQDIAVAQDQPDKNEDEMIQTEMVDQISLEDLQQYWNQITEEYGGYLPELKKMNLREVIQNNGHLSMKNIFIGLLQFLFHEFVLNGKLLGSLLILTLFSSILQTIHAAFEKSSISQISNFVIYIVLIYITLNSFFLVYSYTKDAVEAMSGFMIALIPLILGLLATFGNVLTVSFFHPIVIFLIHVSSVLIKTFILPLLLMATSLSIVSHMNTRYQVTHLANLLKSVSLGTLGVFLTVFLGVMSVQGTASAIQDGVAMKTTKFITGNFIPVIGRTITEAADTVLSASLILKNAIGIVGSLMIILFALFPAIKILAVALIYKVAAAVVQPIGYEPVVTSLNIISKYIFYILACLLIVSLMFYLAIVIIIIASNVTLLMR